MHPGRRFKFVSRVARYLSGAGLLLRHPSLLRPREHIFFLSHMRGYTSLLSHILGSHPEISGYSETWFARGKADYSNSLDLFKLRAVIAHHQNYKATARYVFDKLLHNEIAISDFIIASRKMKWLIMIREPMATIRSIVAFHRSYLEQGSPQGDSAIPATVEAAASYYTGRLDGLRRVAERLEAQGKRYVFIKADEMIEKPREVLDRIQQYLQLRTPLVEQYAVFNRTGKWDWGDTSPYIRKGKIERKRDSHAEIIVPDEVLGAAQFCYDETCRALEQERLS
jgi:hypothetical protein